MIAVINGPNLGILGRRQPQIYGTRSMEEVLEDIRRQVSPHTVEYYQTNHEGRLIDEILRLGGDPTCQGIVLNPGGLAHTSVALRDAIDAIGQPVIEVHISHIEAREDFRRTLITAGACRGMIEGLGTQGYALAAEWLVNNTPQ